ncbi:hypothetical protein [Calothrix sp. NIES-2098]|uniref:hypothetical protein n=1 Tax=Calothrix sp. NIES-2098 TaxID=1954171 RepID=UPI000B5FBB58|nr:hypothetical protein NIES2098_74370 [Calothrix sp. NIES-2098]
MEAKSQIRLKKLVLPIVLGVISSCAVATAFRYWQAKTQGWCVRAYPDGKEEVLYGSDCQKPAD